MNEPRVVSTPKFVCSELNTSGQGSPWQVVIQKVWMVFALGLIAPSFPQ